MKTGAGFDRAVSLDSIIKPAGQDIVLKALRAQLGMQESKERKSRKSESVILFHTTYSMFQQKF